MLGKRKAALRVEESAWSDPFTLDTIEDADKVTCKKKGRDGTSDKQGSGNSTGFFLPQKTAPIAAQKPALSAI